MSSVDQTVDMSGSNAIGRSMRLRRIATVGGPSARNDCRSPFGGVGRSGTGAYPGKAGFDTRFYANTALRLARARTHRRLKQAAK